MDAQKLGRKIREAHLIKRLAQSKVVGGFITRNMLSQIESGAATPSMETLEHLSKVLSVPVSQFVPGSGPIETLTQAKTALAQGQAERALSLVGDFIYGLHGESNAIAARVHLILAQQFAQCHGCVPAATHTCLATERAQRGIYTCADVHVSAFSLLDEIKQP